MLTKEVEKDLLGTRRLWRLQSGGLYTMYYNVDMAYSILPQCIHSLNPPHTGTKGVSFILWLSAGGALPGLWGYAPPWLVVQNPYGTFLDWPWVVYANVWWRPVAGCKTSRCSVLRLQQQTPSHTIILGKLHGGLHQPREEGGDQAYIYRCTWTTHDLASILGGFNAMVSPCCPKNGAPQKWWTWNPANADFLVCGFTSGESLVTKSSIWSCCI